MLEMGAQAAKLEVEFSTGTVWYGGERFSSATLDMPKGGSRLEPVGSGWTLWQRPSTSPWQKCSWPGILGRRSCAET